MIANNNASLFDIGAMLVFVFLSTLGRYKRNYAIHCKCLNVLCLKIFKNRISALCVQRKTHACILTYKYSDGGLATATR